MFESLRVALKDNLNRVMSNPTTLFRIESSGDDLWKTYIEAFPDEVRQEYNCNACRGFIKRYGGLVRIDPETYQMETIWDFQAPGYYQAPVHAMRDLVSLGSIREVFIPLDDHMGLDSNNVLKHPLSNEIVKTWTHLYYKLPPNLEVYVKPTPREALRRPPQEATYDSLLSYHRTNAMMLKRALETIPIRVVEAVLELIASDSIYRGAEKKSLLEAFLSLQQRYNQLESHLRENFYWLESKLKPFVANIRNDVIGSLLVDISEGMSLDTAVKSFERKMDANNYQRTTAAPTRTAVKSADELAEELGIKPALKRRYATIHDVDINNVIYISRDQARPEADDLFGQVAESLPVNPKSFSRVDTVTMEEFIANVVPKSSRIELLFQGHHTPHLVSLITAVDSNAPNILKWNNPFSWSYNSGLGDSAMKERVKQAGGEVDGKIRHSLSWGYKDDLDLHLVEPGGNEIFYRQKISPTGGKLDVDMNYTAPYKTDPVENIIYPHNARIKEGIHRLYVENYQHRDNSGRGFHVEIEHDGELLTFVHEGSLRTGEKIVVAEYDYSKTNGFKLTKGTPTSTGSSLCREVWGIRTNTFYPIQSIMLSPNYWVDPGVGNKHTFFFIEGCTNPGHQVVGFLNEFLMGTFQPHRKTFEMLTSKSMVDPTSKEQLSGLGFSSTLNGELFVRVEGATSRVLRITV